MYSGLLFAILRRFWQALTWTSLLVAGLWLFEAGALVPLPLWLPGHLPASLPASTSTGLVTGGPRTPGRHLAGDWHNWKHHVQFVLVSLWIIALSKNRPLGQFFLVVAMSVYIFVCPLPMYFFSLDRPRLLVRIVPAWRTFFGTKKIRQENCLPEICFTNIFFFNKLIFLPTFFCQRKQKKIAKKNPIRPFGSSGEKKRKYRCYSSHRSCDFLTKCSQSWKCGQKRRKKPWKLSYLTVKGAIRRWAEIR